jgi:hypothetical protein
MDYKWKHFGNKIKCQTTTAANVAFIIIEIYVFIFSLKSLLILDIFVKLFNYIVLLFEK